MHTLCTLWYSGKCQIVYPTLFKFFQYHSAWNIKMLLWLSCFSTGRVCLKWKGQLGWKYWSFETATKFRVKYIVLGDTEHLIFSRLSIINQIWVFRSILPKIDICNPTSYVDSDFQMTWLVRSDQSDQVNGKRPHYQPCYLKQYQLLTWCMF